MTDNINILDKTPEQIFNELTANMDLKTKYGYFKEMHRIFFSVNNSPWNIVRFLYTIFSVYYPSQQQVVNINSHYDILCVGKELYCITPNSPEYKKIPKYLHGVVNKRKNTFMHPYDRHYIVKPARGQSRQYMEQCMKTFDAMLHFEKMQSLYNISDNNNRLLLFAGELYNDILKLVSMTTVCSAPKHKDVINSGSMQMLQEYNLYASVGTVSNAVQNRCNIIEKYRSSNNNVHRFLRQLQDQEMDRLNKRHDEEQKSVKNFEEFQTMLRRQEQERCDLLKSQREKNKIHKQVFAKKQWQIDQARKFEKTKAQMMMARITRMH